MGHVLREARVSVDLLEYGRCPYVILPLQLVSGKPPPIHLRLEQIHTGCILHLLLVRLLGLGHRQQSEGLVPNDRTWKPVKRKTFPQFPWRRIRNHKTIVTKNRDTILADGGYGLWHVFHTLSLLELNNWL